MAAKKKNLCDHCTGQCCKYVALPIATPEDRDDYEDIRWYLCHENISVFVEDDDWYINMKTICRHLIEPGYKCAIYDKRPNICRKYDPDNCDFADGEYQYALHFTNDSEMEEYLKIKFDNNRIEKDKCRKNKRK